MFSSVKAFYLLLAAALIVFILFTPFWVALLVVLADIFVVITLQVRRRQKDTAGEQEIFKKS